MAKTSRKRATAARQDESTATPLQSLCGMGIEGLDSILNGGLPANHLYLIDGDPGTGKTTAGLQFLMAGRDRGERGMYVTLSETADELENTAKSHGWTTEGIDVVQLAEVQPEQSGEVYTLYHPAEVELQQTVEVVLREIREKAPKRVVIDSLSEMRLLARDALRFRRQILALKQFFAGIECTVILLDDRTAPDGDMQLHSLAHGVIILDHLAIDYGSDRRRLQIKKLRGAVFGGGYHDFRIRTGGLDVYPRLETGEASAPIEGDAIASGSTELDSLLGGGLTAGTSTLITGAAGTGKSVACLQYALAAVERGTRVHFFLFDERAATFRLRAKGLGMPLEHAEGSGRLVIQQIEPTQMSPGEFANTVRTAVKENGVTMLVIDSINGYMQAMPSERLLTVQVHELLSFLANHKVTSVMTLVQHGVFGAPVDEAAEVSYLADTVVLLRYFEHSGAVRQAISVVKKRSGAHEHTIRECRVDRGGLRVGEPLAEFRGVLTGVPEYAGREGPLMNPPVEPTARPRSRSRRNA